MLTECLLLTQPVCLLAPSLLGGARHDTCADRKLVVVNSCAHGRSTVKCTVCIANTEQQCIQVLQT